MGLSHRCSVNREKNKHPKDGTLSPAVLLICISPCLENNWLFSLHVIYFLSETNYDEGYGGPELFALISMLFAFGLEFIIILTRAVNVLGDAFEPALFIFIVPV